MGKKDYWNTQPPGERQAVRLVRRPPRAGRAARRPLPGRTFPNLGRWSRRDRPRRPGGHPAHRDPGRDRHRASRTSPARCQADMLRLNTAIPPARQPEHPSASSAATWPDSRTAAGSSTTSSPSSCGRSPARRCPLVDPSYTPDAAVSAITDGLTDTSPAALPHSSPTSACPTTATTTRPDGMTVTETRRRADPAPARRAGTGPRRGALILHHPGEHERHRDRHQPDRQHRRPDPLPRPATARTARERGTRPSTRACRQATTPSGSPTGHPRS